ncbi:Cytosolic endo-beta-N-acetylglucosaminidase [Melia azedarach]|uniref:Cytosolic endo-beta-N-acetylglucosaminidase n=1 Tax=Melia azedarach TaxID=155640 RepID=A0ACC1Y9K5_MELAZ|nr:Cytosolic endo-beta-N-acetylglucosaminidase [Melia azedarach]
MLKFLLLLLRTYINRRTLITLRNFLISIRLRFFITMSDSDDKHQSSSISATDPPPFDPTEPSVPISYPIKTLKDLHSRAYFDSFHYPFNKSTVPLQNAALPDRPRILVCHDMQGGYVDDKWVQGGTNADAYAIWHWYLMDVFVYFSHDLVTLPPPCWTNTAHRHGVKVLGTFITEWAEGKVIANELLSSKESARTYAERLAELAFTLGFDGWLINMEVKLDVERIPNLKEFVSHLTQTMHSSVPGSLVIWYDSITIEGDLKWQNKLNEKNKPFFDICDGIFVNYTWKADYPKLSAAVAGDRKYDVYMGIDVFGRGTFGGGQWNINVALDVLKEDDVSAAIFAPGWVYETKQPPNFQTAQNHWWSLIEKSWGGLQNYPKVLPFYSNFDQGHGLHISIKGGQELDTPWNNISSQGFQPFLVFRDDPNPDIQVLVDFKEASYNGGGNVTFRGTLGNNAQFIARLFQGELLLGDSPVYFTYSVKSEGNSLLGLLLEFSSSTKETKSLLLASWGMDLPSTKFSKVIVPREVKAPEVAPGWVIQECSIVMNGYTMTGISAVCYRPVPEISGLSVESTADGQRNALSRSPAEYFAVLGDITIKNSGQNSDFPPSTSWLVEAQYIKWTSGSEGVKTLNVKIIWALKDGNDSWFPKYNIYVEKQAKKAVGNLDGKLEAKHNYLGVAQVEAFYVSNLVIPSKTDSLRFIIQVCAVDGTSQNLKDSPFLLLDVKYK